LNVFAQNGRVQEDPVASASGELANQSRVSCRNLTAILTRRSRLAMPKLRGCRSLGRPTPSDSHWIVRAAWSDRCRKMFEFCCRFQRVRSALAARVCIPRKRMAIRCTEPRAEKRMSFRCLSRRHLSV